MSLIQRRIEKRVAPHIAPADAFVREFYGLRKKPFPSVVVEPIYEPDFSAEQGGSMIRFNKKLYNAFRSNRLLGGTMVHEMTHYYCRGSILSDMRDLLGSWEKQKLPYFEMEHGEEHDAIKCASEGLARFSQTHYLDSTPPSFLEKSVSFLRKTLRYTLVGCVIATLIELTIVPLTLICLFGTKAFKNKMNGYIDRFEPYCQKHSNKPEPLNHYHEGLEFIKNVYESIGDPAGVFTLVTKHPPKSMAEIKDFVHYLSLHQGVIDGIIQGIADEYMRKRGMAQMAGNSRT